MSYNAQILSCFVVHPSWIRISTMPDGGNLWAHLIAYLLRRFGMQANMKHVAQQRSAPPRATWTQTSGFLVKWLPRNSGERRVLHCRTMGSCLGCRGPSFNQTALQQQWKDCVCIHRQCFIRWHKVGLRLPLIPLKHNLGWASSGYITNNLADRWTHSLSQVFSWNLFSSCFLLLPFSCPQVVQRRVAQSCQACFLQAA